MTLLVDLGNTRLKCATLAAHAPGDVAAFAHADIDTALDAWLARHPREATAWLASVANPELTQRVTDALARHGHRVLRAATQADALGLRVAYADPARLGVDRWLAMLAAREHDTSPVLVASVGSALTLDAVDADGRHLGGLIAPTPEAMRESLFARAPHLRGAAGEVGWFARSTEDAVASGPLLAGVALIERTLAALAAQVGTAPRLCVAGGGIAPLRPWLPPHDHVPDLVLRGLARWARAATPASPLVD